MNPKYVGLQRMGTLMLTTLAVIATLVFLVSCYQSRLKNPFFQNKWKSWRNIANEEIPVGTLEVSGSVVDDSTAAPLADVTVFLTEENTNANLQTQTGSDGKFIFEQLPFSRYSIMLHKPGYLPVYYIAAKNVTVSLNSIRGIVPCQLPVLKSRES